MTRDPGIDRLLGGYATNTLTPAERDSLFEAALNDQDLFNALQGEEALRDLLGDSESRQAIVHALQQPSVEPANPWFSRGWAWGLAATAAAGCAVALVFSFSTTTYHAPAAVAELRSPEAAVIPAPATVPAKGPLARTVKRRAAPAAAAPGTPQDRASDQLATTLQVAPTAGLPAAQMAKSTAFRAEEGALQNKAVAAPIQYVLWKRGADGQFAPIPSGEPVRRGDVVRLVIRPPLSGSLSVSEQSPGGLHSNLNVTAGQEYTIPDAPIEIMGERQLRLVLTTGGPASLVTNIVLAPGKASNGQ